jgi:TATA-binding protein-associated factor
MFMSLSRPFPFRLPGLGKTLQATAILGAASYDLRVKYAAAPRPEDYPLPSLIVCPSTLVDHWAFEINKFVDKGILCPLTCQGTPTERARAQGLFEKGGYNVLVISYEGLRADIAWVQKVPWLYCVLDEGHVIKNAKSKTAVACYGVNAK